MIRTLIMRWWAMRKAEKLDRDYERYKRIRAEMWKRVGGIDPEAVDRFWGTS